MRAARARAINASDRVDAYPRASAVLRCVVRFYVFDPLHGSLRFARADNRHFLGVVLLWLDEIARVDADEFIGAVKIREYER